MRTTSVCEMANDSFVVGVNELSIQDLIPNEFANANDE